MTTPFPFVAGQVLTAAQLNDIQNLPISDKTASYTLIAGDETKRTMMNNASATTITVNNSIFTVGDVIQVANKGAGTCTITAGAGVTINTSGSLSLAQYGGGYLVAISASSFLFFNLGSGANYGVATGGTATTISVGSPAQSYTLLTISTDTNLVVSKSGLFDVLLIGGGAGGGFSSAGAPTATGGGGAGGVLGLVSTCTIYLEASSIAVDVGAGGAASGSSFNAGSPGLNSAIGNFIGVPGGGGGGSHERNYSGSSGASSGGAVASASALDAAFTIGGNKGGNGGGTNSIAGGGGGSGSAGGNGSSTTGGSGGSGSDISTFITGATAYRAAGAGGGGSGTGGAAGNGGVAGVTSGTGNNANTAGSGGGGANNAAGGAGAAGIVYVRFKI